MRDLFLKSLSILGFHIIQIIQGVVWLIGSAVTVALCRIVYRKIRCKFPITVNCWFCDRNTTVAYDNANCWDCPHCDQYNGFTKDGGYNKVIEEQHTQTLNTVVFNTLKPEVSKQAANGFCKLCNINQHLKVQQLALFSPINENNYDYEIEQYREQLEKSYRLCARCETTLQQTLQQQQYDLLKDRLNIQRLKSDSSNFMQKYDYQPMLLTAKKLANSGLRWIASLVATLLTFAHFLHLETEFTFLSSTLPDLSFLEFDYPILQVILKFLGHSRQFNKELTAIGFSCYLLSMYSHQTTIDHAILVFWGLIHGLAWTNLDKLEFLMTIVVALFNWHALRSTHYYVFKKQLPKKSSYQPERTENTIRNDMSTLPLLTTLTEPILAKAEVKIPPTLKEKRKTNEKECFLEKKEIESHIDDSELKKRPTKISPKGKSNGKSKIKSSLFSKSFLEDLESESNDLEINPPEEIYNDLLGLHLGSNSDKSNKPSNFLFENHNFVDKNKRNSSIIKPAKFVRNPINSWTCGGEFNESVSRSSTPSSGYSSQKADKPESTKNSFEFSKAMSPISIPPYSRVTPPENFDYYDPNQNLFGHVNYFSPGFVPYQQFPSPMGHTTVFSYTRPTNFPYPFPPPPHSYRYSPMSTGFSDVSDTENIFQNTSQSYQVNRKWIKLKSIFYNASIFLNLCTIFALLYSVCAGFISVDWKLPHFDFLV